MKAYRKALTKELIDHLNNLYEETGSWWQKIVDDDQVFILVRENELHVLVNGGLLLKITIDNNGKIVCKTHEEFLSLRSEADPYVTISENSTAPPKRVEGLAEFVKHYDQIKRRIKLFVGNERQDCHTMSLNIKEIVEREVGLVLEKSEMADRNKAQFVDFQAVSAEGKMVFVEVKLLSNSGIHSLKIPPVVKQLRKYEDIIKSHKRQIIDAYIEQYETYSKLNGAFFEKKLPHPSKIDIHSTVRLIITEFDGAQLKVLLPRIRENIEKGMGWETNSSNLITVGNPINVNAGHIFKGLQWN
jgi:hypothetical protein